MQKVLVKYIKGLDTYVPGDIRAVNYKEYKELQKGGFAVKTELLEEIDDEQIVKDSLKGHNILGIQYKPGLIDVVIPTKSEKNVESLSILKKAEKDGQITLTIMTREFNEQTGGFARSCNDGANLDFGRGEFILFLNDDVKLGKNFFKDLIKPFEREIVGLVGAKCSEVGFGVNGSVMCIRRELFENIGGFDETYFFMWEDNDMCKNVKKRGFEIDISEAEAEHEGKDSVNTGSEFWRVHYYNGKNYHDHKWHGEKRLIGSMIVGDENDRYMTRVILDLFKRDLIDELVVVCDKSNKETVAELEVIKKYFPITIKYHDYKLFGVAENLLRERATDYAISKNPFGILPIDADEFLDPEMDRREIMGLLGRGIAFDLVLAHFWGNEHTVRTDGCFAHQKNIRLFRYCPEFSQKFFDRNLHCGSAPIYAYQNRKDTDFILHHFGYVKKRDVVDKKKRQMKHDPKMLLENPDLYNRMIEEGETMTFNKLEYLKLWKK